MRIDHVAIYAHDIECVRDFFVHYFGASAGAVYHNVRTGFRSYFLVFGDGSRLEIMTCPGLSDDAGPSPRCGLAHIAMGVGSREAVDELTCRLGSDGYEGLSGPRTTGDGYYESCILGPENNLIEITGE